MFDVGLEEALLRQVLAGLVDEAQDLGVVAVPAEWDAFHVGGLEEVLKSRASSDILEVCDGDRDLHALPRYNIEVVLWRRFASNSSREPMDGSDE